MRLVEDGTLDVTDNIAILTDDLAQSHFTDLGQLGLAEPRFSRVVLVPKAIASLQFLELNADDAGKSGAHQSPLQGRFTQAPGEQVDVIHVLVHLKIHILKLPIFTKFTFLKSHFPQNSHF